jgi:hypothetical protein
VFLPFYKGCNSIWKVSKKLFISSLQPRDCKLLQTNGEINGNTIVAIDGSGNYTKVMDAISHHLPKAWNIM